MTWIFMSSVLWLDSYALGAVGPGSVARHPSDYSTVPDMPINAIWLGEDVWKSMFSLRQNIINFMVTFIQLCTRGSRAWARGSPPLSLLYCTWYAIQCNMSGWWKSIIVFDAKYLFNNIMVTFNVKTILFRASKN